MKKLALLILALAVMASPGWAQNYYVKMPKDGGKDTAAGTAWDTAFATIEKALDRAGANDNIYVAKGTYRPKGTYTNNNNNPAPLSIVSSVDIYGGYPETSTGTTLGERDLSEGVTTITCSNDHRVSLIGIVTNLSLNIVIDGFTLTNGEDAEGPGAGIFINNENGTVTVQNCVIKNNEAVGNGGGMYVQTGTVNVINSVFNNNKAGGDGGGMYIGKGATATIAQCSFTNNKATGTGGSTDYKGYGGALNTAGTLTLTNSTFTGNGAATGENAGLGGAVYINGGSPNINYCTFVNNTATTGAEIYNNSSANVTIKNSLIWNKDYNTTAIARNNNNENSSVTLDHCATAAGTGTGGVKISSWATQNSKTLNTGIPHTVFLIESNDALLPLVGAADATGAPEKDQLGNQRRAPHTIGAVEYYGSPTSKTPSSPNAFKINAIGGTPHHVGAFYCLSLDVAPASLSADCTWTPSNSTLPSTLNGKVVGNTYVISGTPTEAKTYKVTLTAKKGDYYTATKDVTVTIDAISVSFTDPTKESDLNIAVDAGSSLGSKTLYFTATGAESFTWTVEPTSSRDITAKMEQKQNDPTIGKLTLDGTPKTPGTYTFTVKAQASGGGEGHAEVKVTVNNPSNINLGEDRILTKNIDETLDGQELKFTASPNLDYNWTVDDSTTGSITKDEVTATITKTGTGNTATLKLSCNNAEKLTKQTSYVFNVKATFGTGAGAPSGKATVTLNVNDPNVTVKPQKEKFEGATAGTPLKSEYQTKVEAKLKSGGDTTWTWTVDDKSGSSEKDGVKASITGGSDSIVTLAFSGTPIKATTYTFTVKAKAENGKSSTCTVSLEVGLPQNITVTPTKNETVKAKVGDKTFSPEKITFTVDPAMLSYAWAVENGEQDGIEATIDSKNGELTFSGKPTKDGTYKFKVMATFTTADGKEKKVGEKEITVDVAPATLESIAVSVNNDSPTFVAKKGSVTSWNLGKELSPKVTGTYSDATSADVTNACTLTWSTTEDPTADITLNADGTLKVDSTVEANTYTVEAKVTATHTKTEKTNHKNSDITVKVTEATLNSLTVTSTTPVSLTLDQGGSQKLDATVTVTGHYIDETTGNFDGTPSSYTLKWEKAGEAWPTGITLDDDGTFHAAADAPAGSHQVKVSAKATAEGITGKSDPVTVNITVNEGVEQKFKGLTVAFTQAPIALSVVQGKTATANFAATATATYKKGTETIEKHPNVTLSLVNNTYSWITFSGGKVTASPTALVTEGAYKVTVRATATAENTTKTADTALLIAVTKPGTSLDPFDENGNLKLEDGSTLIYAGFVEADKNLVAIIKNTLTQLLEGLPENIPFFEDLSNLKFPPLDDLFDALSAFLIKVEKEREESKAVWSVVATLSPISATTAPGVYLLKINVSEDKQQQLENSFNLEYHIELLGEDSNKDTGSEVKLSAAPKKASDGSYGILVGKDGKPLGSYYDKGDLNLVLYLAQANKTYAQYLTMEQGVDGPTSSKGPGCDRGCNSGFAGLAVIALLEVLFLPSLGKKKNGGSRK